MSKTKKSAKFNSRMLVDGGLNYNNSHLTIGNTSNIAVPSTRAFTQVYKSKVTKFGDKFRLKTILGNSSTETNTYIVLGGIYENIVIDGEIGIAGGNKVSLSINMTNAAAENSKLDNLDGYNNYFMRGTKNGLDYLVLVIQNVLTSAPIIADIIFSEDVMNKFSIVNSSYFDDLSAWDFTKDGSLTIYETFALPVNGWYDFESCKMSNGKVFLAGGTIPQLISNEEGGENTTTRISDTYMFDPQSKTFTKDANMPIPVANHRMVALKNNQALVVGGTITISNENGTYSSSSTGDTFIYLGKGNNSVQTWSRIGPWYATVNGFTLSSHGLTYDPINDYVYCFVTYYRDYTVSPASNVYVNQLTRKKVNYDVNGVYASLGALETLTAIPETLKPLLTNGNRHNNIAAPEIIFNNGKIYLPMLLSTQSLSSGAVAPYGLVYDIASSTWSKFLDTGLYLVDSGGLTIYKNKIYACGWQSQFAEGTSADTIPTKLMSDMTYSDMAIFDTVNPSLSYGSPVNTTNDRSIIDKTLTGTGTSSQIEALDDGRIVIFGGGRSQAYIPEAGTSAGGTSVQNRSFGFMYYPENDKGIAYTGIRKVIGLDADTYHPELNNTTVRNPLTRYRDNLFILNTGDIDNPIDPLSSMNFITKFTVSSETVSKITTNLPSGFFGAGFVVDKTNAIAYIVGGKTISGISNKVYTSPATSMNVWTETTVLPKALYGIKTVSDSAGNIYVLGGKDSTGADNLVMYKFTKSSSVWSTQTTLPYPVNGDIDIKNDVICIAYGYTEAVDGNKIANNKLSTYNLTTSTRVDVTLSTINSLFTDEAYITGLAWLNNQSFRMTDNNGRQWKYDSYNVKMIAENTHRMAITSSNGMIKLSGDKCAIITEYGELYICHLYQRTTPEQLNYVYPSKEAILSNFNSAISGNYSDVTSWENLGKASCPLVYPCVEYDDTTVFFSYNVPVRRQTSSTSGTTPRNIIGFYNTATKAFTFIPNSIMSSIYGTICSDENGNVIVYGGQLDGFNNDSIENGISYTGYDNIAKVFSMAIYRINIKSATVEKIKDLTVPYSNGAYSFDKDSRKLYLFSGIAPLKFPYNDYPGNSPCSTVKCFSYDVYTNTITQLASLPDYGLKHSNAVRISKDKILIFGGSKGLVNDSVVLSTLPRDIGFPNTKMYEYSISGNSFTEVSNRYAFQLEFQGITNGKNEFHEVIFAERLPDIESEKVLIYTLAWFSCKAGTSGYVHDAYTPNLYGFALHTLDLSNNKFELMNTYGLGKFSYSADLTGGIGNKSGLFPDINGILYDMSTYYSNTGMTGRPSKNGVIRVIN